MYIYIYYGTHVNCIHHLMVNKTSKLVYVQVIVSACVKGGAVATGSAVPLHGPRGVPQRRFGSLPNTAIQFL